MKNLTSRRKVLKQLAAGTLATAIIPPLQPLASTNNIMKDLQLKGNINHSVCAWTYGHLSLDELCIEVKKLGLGAIDLAAPKDWPVLQKHGIYCSMCYTAGNISLTEGWNNKSFHAALTREFTEAIPLVAKAGYKNLICFSGNRNGMDDETGMNNCVEGLKPILSLAEKQGVIIQM